MPNKNKTIYNKVQKWITSRIPLPAYPTHLQERIILFSIHFHCLRGMMIIYFSPDFAQSVLRVLLVISLDVVSLLLIAQLTFAIIFVVIMAVVVVVVSPDEELQSSRR